MAKYVYVVRIKANKYEPVERLLQDAGFDCELLEAYGGSDYDDDDENEGEQEDGKDC